MKKPANKLNNTELDCRENEMPLDDAIDWEVMGPKYRTRVIELETKLGKIQSMINELSWDPKTRHIARTLEMVLIEASGH